MNKQRTLTGHKANALLIGSFRGFCIKEIN